MTLVDTNVLIDILTSDRQWAAWSEKALAEAADKGGVAVNPIIYAELSAGLRTKEAVEEALGSSFGRLNLPWDAAFLAGKCFAKYKRAGGPKTAPLPDFFIGAHAQVSDLTLLTRDAARYLTYFPGIRLIAP